MLVWVVTGAKRKVGKTHLAKRLCAVLSNSIYAKLGHGHAKDGKSTNYFTNPNDLLMFIEEAAPKYAHAVVEATMRDYGGVKSIRIFIDSPCDPALRRSDADELRELADIRLEIGASSSEWQRELERRPLSAEVVSAVLSVLSEHFRWLEHGDVAVHSKVWLVNQDREHVFGPGIADLLTEIEHLGSLKAAALKTGISYRHAWGSIRCAEKHFNIKLISATPGGAGGGKSVITDDARRVLKRFRLLSERVSDYANSLFARIFTSEDGMLDG